jgi:molybdopterin molybdotransferase
VFGRPALEVLAGGAWFEPQGYSVPAAFKKNKREGRNEYLRARLNLDGHCEVFPSEGSGRISSISWSDGLVVLGHDAVAVTPGVLVHYVPYRNYMRPS